MSYSANMKNVMSMESRQRGWRGAAGCGAGHGCIQTRPFASRSGGPVKEQPSRRDWFDGERRPAASHIYVSQHTHRCNKTAANDFISDASCWFPPVHTVALWGWWSLTICCWAAGGFLWSCSAVSSWRTWEQNQDL